MRRTYERVRTHKRAQANKPNEKQKMAQETQTYNNEEIVIYRTQDGLTKFDVRLEADTVWITQDQMTELFLRDKSTISRHIKNIFADGELDEKSVVAFFATTAADGKLLAECKATIWMLLFL